MNTLKCVVGCRPDGQKKAYVRLASDYDALDVANKVLFSYKCTVVFSCSFRLASYKDLTAFYNVS